MILLENIEAKMCKTI